MILRKTNTIRYGYVQYCYHSVLPCTAPDWLGVNHSPSSSSCMIVLFQQWEEGTRNDPCPILVHLVFPVWCLDFLFLSITMPGGTLHHNARRDSLHVKVVCLGNDTCIWKGVREAMSVNYLAGACAEVEKLYPRCANTPTTPHWVSREGRHFERLFFTMSKVQVQAGCTGPHVLCISKEAVSRSAW